MNRVGIIVLHIFLLIFVNGKISLAEIRGYLDVFDIEGNSTNPDYLNWIEVANWEWQMSSSGSMRVASVTQRSDSVVFRPVTITKEMDISSIPLMFKFAKGEIIPSAKIVFQEQEGTKFEVFRMELTPAFVVDMSVSGDKSTGEIVESVSFSFTEVCLTHSYLDGGGSVITTNPRCWNMETNSED